MCCIWDEEPTPVFGFFFPKSVTSYLLLLVDSNDIFSAIEFLLSSFSMEEAYEYLDKCGFQRNVDGNQSQGEGQCFLVTQFSVMAPVEKRSPEQHSTRGDTQQDLIHLQ